MRAFLFLIFISITNFAVCQNHPLFVSTGAKSLSLANTSVSQEDVWANFNNQAGLARLEHKEFAVFFEDRYFNSGLNTIGFAAAMPTKSGTFGIGYKRFGVADLFNQSNTSINYGRLLSENFSIGAGISYLNTFIGNNYGQSSSISAHLGFIAKLNESLFLSSHVSNLNRAKVAEFNDERYPTLLTVGLKYLVSEKVATMLEVDKDMMHKPSYRGAVDYNIIENFFVRIGVASNPTLFSFGVGYSKNAFTIDYGASLHQVLGLTNNISLSYALGK